MTYLYMDFVLVSRHLKIAKNSSTREQADEGSRPMLGVNCLLTSRESQSDTTLTIGALSIPANGAKRWKLRIKHIQILAAH